eukprot:scaffold19752_cov52-Attheya_sp.AAC.5
MEKRILFQFKPIRFSNDRIGLDQPELPNHNMSVSMKNERSLFLVIGRWGGVLTNSPPPQPATT